jgi:hypothetical protein
MPLLPALAFASLVHISVNMPLAQTRYFTDSTRVVKGFGGQQYAWGKVLQRKGQVIQAYFPTGNSGFDGLVCYYPEIPDNAPLPKPKLLAVANVQWMRVHGQYSELLQPDKRETGRLAARRVAGPVELFVVATAPPTVMALGPVPVLGSPVTTSGSTLPGTATWYLRRSGGSIVALEPARFSQQLAAYLSDDPELARRVAEGQAGYRLEQLESIIQQYNQRAQHR